MKNAKKTGVLKKRLDPAKIWEKFHCVISGAYLYFYRDQD
jgi:hypothetical protein